MSYPYSPRRVSVSYQLGKNLDSPERAGLLGVSVEDDLVRFKGGVKSCPLWVAPVPPGTLGCETEQQYTSITLCSSTVDEM